MYIRILTFRMFPCSRLPLPLNQKKRESDWYKRRRRRRRRYSDLQCCCHIINLYGLASFSLLISWNITIYLAPKARRKWSIRCSGRTRVISHFTNRHIFVTYCGTIALFRKITIYTTRPTTTFTAILHKLHNSPMVSYFYFLIYFLFIFYESEILRPHISLLLLLLFPISNKAVISNGLKTTTQFITLYTSL